MLHKVNWTSAHLGQAQIAIKQSKIPPLRHWFHRRAADAGRTNTSVQRPSISTADSGRATSFLGMNVLSQQSIVEQHGEIYLVLTCRKGRSVHADIAFTEA